MRKIKEFFLYYIPYFVYSYYEGDEIRNFSTFMALVGIVNLFFSSIIFSIIDFLDRYNLYSTLPILLQRFVIIPLIASPSAIAMYYFYSRNKEKYKIMFEKFNKEATEIKRNKKVYAGIFIALAFISFVLSIFVI